MRIKKEKTGVQAGYLYEIRRASKTERVCPKSCKLPKNLTLQGDYHNFLHVRMFDFMIGITVVLTQMKVFYVSSTSVSEVL